jgi:hypothetical protein
MNGESARLEALPNYSQTHRSPLAGQATAHLKNGYSYSGWVEIGGGVITIDGRLRTAAGPSHCIGYAYRAPVKRTYPVSAIARIDWHENGR